MNVDPVIHSDPGMVFKYVLFNEGDYSGLEPGKYMNYFLYQLGLLTFLRPFTMISDNSRWFFFIYLLLYCGTQLFLWKFARLMFDINSLASKYVTVFGYMFLPQFFFISFIYGEGPGTMLACMAVYFMMCQFKGKGTYYWGWCALCIGRDCVVRVN